MNVEAFHKASRWTATALILGICLFGSSPVFQGSRGFISWIIRETLSLMQDSGIQWMLLISLGVWCGVFYFLAFGLNDFSLIGLWLVAIAACFIGSTMKPRTDGLTFLAGVTLGRGTNFFLNGEYRVQNEKCGNTLAVVNRKSAIKNFLSGLVGLLAFSSWWHLDMTNNFYHGPRWMGLWDNPNTYGMLMSAGVVLAIGLLATNPKSQGQILASLGDTLCQCLKILLLIVALMMGVGLLFSYSRGSWTGTAFGLLYLAKAYGKFKWRYLLPPIFLSVAVVCFCWNTPRSAPWYFQRLDFSRGSVQHRLAAWKAGLEIIRDHPLGTGWNKTVEIYEEYYSPPDDGAAAITTNDYIMLGTQLGISGLICFVTYAVLQLGIKRWPIRAGKWKLEGDTERIEDCNSEFGIKTACRAAAIAMLVEFWFDGGLFKLATASVFWILLELGAPERKRKFVKERKPQAAPAL
jgi:hypothetical protein